VKGLVGWREWVGLPDLGIRYLKAKIDTGAKTCSLHAMHIKIVEQDGMRYARFHTSPVQGRSHALVLCQAPLVDVRDVTNSGGQTETRYVIHTHMRFRDHSFDCEMTLTERGDMAFQMLVGRNALRNRFIVDSGGSFLQGKPPQIIPVPKSARKPAKPKTVRKTVPKQADSD